MEKIISDLVVASLGKEAIAKVVNKHLKSGEITKYIDTTIKNCIKEEVGSIVSDMLLNNDDQFLQGKYIEDCVRNSFPVVAKSLLDTEKNQKTMEKSMQKTFDHIVENFMDFFDNEIDKYILPYVVNILKNKFAIDCKNNKN